jgi:tellurite resistance protein TerC
MLLIDVFKIPIAWSLGFTVAVLIGSMLLSLRIPPKGRVGTAYPFAAKKEREESAGRK